MDSDKVLHSTVELFIMYLSGEGILRLFYMLQ